MNECNKLGAGCQSIIECYGLLMVSSLDELLYWVFVVTMFASYGGP